MALHKLKNGTEIDLAEEGLVPHTVIATERAAKTQAETALQAAQKQIEAAQARESLLNARIGLAVGAPDERDIRRVLAAYKADQEGVEKPEPFEKWAAGDGAKIVQAIRPAVETKVEATKPDTKPETKPETKPDAKPEVKAPPNTSTNTVDAKPEGGMTPQQLQNAADSLLESYRKAATQEEKTSIRKQLSDLEAKARAGTAAQV